MELRLDAAHFVLFGFDASVAVDGVECAASACVVNCMVVMSAGVLSVVQKFIMATARLRCRVVVVFSPTTISSVA